MSWISFQLMCLALIGLVIVLGQSRILRELRNIGKELGEINDSGSGVADIRDLCIHPVVANIRVRVTDPGGPSNPWSHNDSEEQVSPSLGGAV
jgi:hypothetical protein